MPPGDVSQPLKVLSDIRDILAEILGVDRDAARQAESRAQAVLLEEDKDQREEQAREDNEPHAKPLDRPDQAFDAQRRAVAEGMREAIRGGGFPARGGDANTPATTDPGERRWNATAGLLSATGFGEIAGLMHQMSNLSSSWQEFQNAWRGDSAPSLTPHREPSLQMPQPQPVPMEVVHDTYPLKPTTTLNPTPPIPLAPTPLPTPYPLQPTTLNPVPLPATYPLMPMATPYPLQPTTLNQPTPLPATYPLAPTTLNPTPGQTPLTPSPRLEETIPLRREARPTLLASGQEMAANMAAGGAETQTAEEMLRAAMKLLEAAQKLEEAAQEMGGDETENGENWSARDWNDDLTPAERTPAGGAIDALPAAPDSPDGDAVRREEGGGIIGTIIKAAINRWGR